MLAIIPARGGSKRLPRKNIAPFRGKPIIAWTIEAAEKSGCFSKIVVSTDDEEIAAVAAKYWVSIDKRPANLATDQARVHDVCLELLGRQSLCDVFSCLYATAPLRTAEDIRAVVELVKPGRCDFACAVTDTASPHQALKVVDGFLEPMWPELVEKRHNEIPHLLIDNGSTYAATVEAFQKCKTFYGPNMRGHIMPRERSVDIDTQMDLDYALWLGSR